MRVQVGWFLVSRCAVCIARVVGRSAASVERRTACGGNVSSNRPGGGSRWVSQVV